ncbi:MAG: MATE family multidrug resistance protein [Polyangiales bacterium]|jgi:MATE family multidrug resistance protein
MKTELRRLVALAAPLAVLQIAMSTLGVVGMAVVGELGAHPELDLDAAVEQGAVGLGNTLFFAVAVLGMGVVFGFDPLISQAVGAGEDKNARRLTWQAGYMAIGASLLLMVVMVVVVYLLPATALEPPTAAATGRYLLWRAPSLLPFLVAGAARAYLQSIGKTRPLIVAAVVANVVNIPLTLILALGDVGLAKLGLPPMGLPANGASGAALAASVSLGVMGALLLLATSKVGHFEKAAPDKAILRRGLSLGAPLSLQLGAEVGAFALVSYFAGTLGAAVLAAHHIALTLASIPFQMSIALGAAAAVRVGVVIGEGRDPAAPRRAGYCAIGLGAILSCTAGALFATMPGSFAELLATDEDVLQAAASLIVIAAAFQLVDGAQAITAGALRGAGDTRATMFANIAGHYGIGLPIGVTWCFKYGGGAPALWWGLSAGLAAVSVLLVARFHWVSGGGRLARV